jgi:hypothetical protein
LAAPDKNQTVKPENPVLTKGMAMKDVIVVIGAGQITGSDFLMDGGVTAAYWYGELAQIPDRR